VGGQFRIRLGPIFGTRTQNLCGRATLGPQRQRIITRIIKSMPSSFRRLRSTAPPSKTFGTVRFRSLRRSGGIRAKGRRFYTQLAALRKYSIIGQRGGWGSKRAARQRVLYGEGEAGLTKNLFPLQKSTPAYRILHHTLIKHREMIISIS
jgi:hypothetical protein